MRLNLYHLQYLSPAVYWFTPLIDDSFSSSDILYKLEEAVFKGGFIKPCMIHLIYSLVLRLMVCQIHIAIIVSPQAVSNAKDKGDMTHMEPVVLIELNSLAGDNDEENSSDKYENKHEPSQVCTVDQQVSDSSQHTKNPAIMEELYSTKNREATDSTDGSHEEVENASSLNQTDNTTTNQSHDTVRERLNMRKKLWLLTSKGVWFLVGGVFVVVAAIVGHFQSEPISVGNCTNITGDE